MHHKLNLLRRCAMTSVLVMATALLIVPVASGTARIGARSSSARAASITVAPAGYLIVVTVPVNANTPASVKVTALDSSGHRLTSFNSSSVTWSDTSGAVPPGTPLNPFVNGVSSGNMLDVPAPMRADQIVVTDGTVTNHSASFEVHGPLTQYAIAVAQPAQAASPTAVTVSAEDAAGDLVHSYNSSSVTWSDSSGAVAPGTPLNQFVNGVSSDNSLTVTNPSKHDKITVTDGTITNTTMFPVYGPLTHFTIGFIGPITENQPETTNVFAQDAAGNTLRSYNSSSVTWSDSSGAIAPGTPLKPFVHGNSYGNTFTVTQPVSSDTITVTDGTVTNSRTLAVKGSGVPTAGNVSYTGAIGNTTFGVGTTPSQPSTSTSGTVLSNSSDSGGNSITAVPGTIATTSGGSVVLKSDGTFTYTPVAGYTGDDTFGFTITDGGATSSAIATVTVANMVWYVNSGGADGNGTSTSPFSQLSEAASSSAANTDIFLFGSTTSYTGGITLKSGQSLVGQSANLVVGGQTVSSATGGNPTITSSGTGVTLSEGTNVSGITVSGAAVGMSATSVNAFTLDPSDVISNSSGDGLDVSGGGGTINAGASISGSGGHSVSISGRTSGTVAMSGSINDTGSGVHLDNTGGEIDFTGGVTASTGTSPAFTALGGGTVTVTGSSNTLATSTATALDVENVAIGAAGIRFESISAGSPSAGPVNAIILENTGTAGGLTVTGDGSGGTCGPVTSANPTPNCSGGTIYNSPGSGSLSAQYAAVEVGAIENSPATTAVPLGSLSLNNMQIAGVSGGGYGVYASTLSTVDIVGSYISKESGEGIQVTSWGGTDGTFDIDANTLVGISGGPIDVVYSNGPVIATGSQSGYIENNIVGDPAVENSGSIFSDGISAAENGTGTMTVFISGNHVNGVEQWYGIQAGAGHGTTAATMKNNNVDNTEVYKNGTDIGSLDALDVSAGNGPMCANVTGNTGTASNTNFQGGGYDAVGASVGSDGPNAFQLQGYGGPTNDSGGQVENLLNTTNTLSGPNNPIDESIAYDNGSGLDFTGGTCAVPTFSALGKTAPPLSSSRSVKSASTHVSAAAVKRSPATERAESRIRARAWRETTARPRRGL